MTNCTVWIIEPRDPFIARDGKPFGIGAGARAVSLPFPFPSTTTGGFRTRAGLDANVIFDASRQISGRALIEAVKEIAVRGPLLVELKDEDVGTWLMHAPADALLLEDESDKDEAQIRRLLPLDAGAGITNLSQAPHGGDNLVPVGLSTPDPRKPFGGAPRFWRWEKFKKWLLDPDSLTGATVKPSELGHGGAESESRTHVAIDPQSLTALKGQLFQTRGLEFTRCEGRELKTAARLGLAVCVEDNTLAGKVKGGLAPLGGERRVVAWRASAKGLPDECLIDLQKQILKDKACRVVLLTPAYFTNGSSPTWLRSTRHGVKVELAAVATGRGQVISGWDFERNVPKPTRRLAPAGAVLFLRLEGTGQDVVKDIETWVVETWMHCVSDDDPADPDAHRRDGFGLAALGVWDGQLQKMKASDDDEKTTEQ